MKTLRQIQELRALHEDMQEHLSSQPPPQKIRGTCSCCENLVDDHIAKEAAAEAIKDEPRDKWKKKLAHKLHSRQMHVTASVLLLIDVAVIFTDLFLESLYECCFFR